MVDLVTDLNLKVGRKKKQVGFNFFFLFSFVFPCLVTLSLVLAYLGFSSSLNFSGLHCNAQRAFSLKL